MTKKKKHHYIPRFYLKRFSINEEGKFIGLFNHKNNTFIQNAQLKSQACEDYLYGKDDEIENLLAELENEIAKLFAYWIDDKALHPLPENSNGFVLLKRFILYQLFRTPKAGTNAIDSVNSALEVIKPIVFPQWPAEVIRDLKFMHDDPVQLALCNAYDKEKLLNFLSFKFIVNLSELPFICSDSPVILYNQLMEKCGSYIGATGLGSKGLQVFYPIHPRLMICLYDAEIYNCGMANNINASFESIEDAHQLNMLQYINSHNQTFFGDYIEKDYMALLKNRCKSIREKPREISQFIKGLDGKQYVFHAIQGATIDLNLTFFNIKKADHKILGLVPLRHPSLA